jgi:hypothetical protein
MRVNFLKHCHCLKLVQKMLGSPAQVSIVRRCTKKGTNECLFPQFPAGYHVVIHAMIHTKLSAQSGKIFVVILLLH